eukprot:9472756-Pyramimonas_sp.AAC.1
MSSLDLYGRNERVCAVKVDTHGGISRTGGGYIVQFAGASCIVTCSSVVDSPNMAKETTVHFNGKDGMPLRPLTALSTWCMALDQVRLSPYRVWITSPMPMRRTSDPVQDLEADSLDFTIVAIHEEDELIVRHLANESLLQLGSREADLAGKQVHIRRRTPCSMSSEI